MRLPKLPNELVQVIWIILWALVNIALVEFGRLAREPLFLFIGVITFLLLLDAIGAIGATGMSWVYAKRGWVALGVFLAGTLACTAFFVFQQPTATPIGDARLVVAQFLLQGVIVGITLRMLMTASIGRTLRLVSTNVQKVLFLLGLTAAILLFPLGKTHQPMAGWYVFGMGVGFLLHYAIRRNEHNHAKHSRTRQSILRITVTITNNNENKLEDWEFRAIKLFARCAWWRLGRHLAKYEHAKSPAVAIVKAARQRIRGKHDEGRRTIEAALNYPELTDEQKACLLVQQALNQGELNKPEDMYRSLESARLIKLDCLLARVTLALRMAEEMPPPVEYALPHSGNIRNDAPLSKLRQDVNAPLTEIQEALRLNEQDIAPALVRAVIGAAEPVTWTFLLDAYAYVLFKSGQRYVSKALLNHCIYEDPTFSSPYLHLAEWHAADMKLKEKPDERKRARELALLCLSIARRLERKKDSLTYRRAMELEKALTAG